MLAPDLAAEDHCYLTTVGRVTGALHTIEIWFASEGPEIFLLAGAGDRADWVRNLAADPVVRVRIREREWVGWARVVTEPDDRTAAADLVFSKYQPRYDGDLVRWRETALPVAVLLADVHQGFRGEPEDGGDGLTPG